MRNVIRINTREVPQEDLEVALRKLIEVVAMLGDGHLGKVARIELARFLYDVSCELAH